MTIQGAISTIIDAGRSSKPGSYLNYAASYAFKARNMRTGTEAFRTQLLYIKANLVYWRGEAARQVKQVIDEELSK